MRLRGLTLQMRLPSSPTLQGLDWVRRALVRTYEWDDYCPPCAHLWGTGVFVHGGEKDDDPPRYILTSGCNIGGWKQQVYVQQGKQWATARVVAYDYNRVVALLEVRDPDRFANWHTSSTALPLADDEDVQKAERDDDVAVLIGYHHRFFAHHGYNIQALLPAPLQAHAVKHDLTIDYMPRLRGAPILTRAGIVGLAIGYTSEDRMTILPAPELRRLVQSALNGASAGTVSLEESGAGDQQPSYRRISSLCKWLNGALPYDKQPVHEEV